MSIPQVPAVPQAGATQSTRQEPASQKPVLDPAARQTTLTAEQAKDLVVGQERKVCDSGDTDLRRRVEELEAERTRRVEQDAARDAIDEDKARKPGFFRKVLEAAETFLRSLPVIGQLINMLSAVFRVGLILFTDKKLTDEQKIRLVGDLAGIFYPMAGAVAHAGANYWFDNSEVLGGVNKLWDNRTVQEYDESKRRFVERKQAVEVRSGARDATDGLTGTLKGLYEGAKRLITGGVDLAPARGIDTRPLKPAEIPVG